MYNEWKHQEKRENGQKKKILRMAENIPKFDEKILI